MFKLDIENIVKKKFEVIKNLRKELNDNAELSFKEYKTSDIIKKFLDSLNIETKTFVSTGVVGILNNDKNCIAVRADMDALPVNGVSHACGHDFHMAVVLGTALVLKEIGFNKNVKFIFQPGEEDAGGALPMIEEGVLENPNVKYIIGLHVWPTLEVGKIQVTSGASMGSVDDFSVKFLGKGGHAAMPFLCKNPIYPTIDFIQSFNNKILTENDVLNPFIVTFSSIKAGEACNVISDESKVLGTVRTFDNALRDKVKIDLTNAAILSGKKYNCDAKVEYEVGYPPLINNKALTDSFVKVTKDIIGEENVLPLNKSFAAEDFSFFAEKVPSVHFRLGISEGEKGNENLHSAKFNGSDNALLYGVLIVVNFILKMADKI